MMEIIATNQLRDQAQAPEAELKALERSVIARREMLGRVDSDGDSTLDAS
jgi:hypothetical protein